jgi:hypothetical protein
VRRAVVVLAGIAALVAGIVVFVRGADLRERHTRKTKPASAVEVAKEAPARFGATTPGLVSGTILGPVPHPGVVLVTITADGEIVNSAHVAAGEFRVPYPWREGGAFRAGFSAPGCLGVAVDLPSREHDCGPIGLSSAAMYGGVVRNGGGDVLAGALLEMRRRDNGGLVGNRARSDADGRFAIAVASAPPVARGRRGPFAIYVRKAAATSGPHALAPEGWEGKAVIRAEFADPVRLLCIDAATARPLAGVHVQARAWRDADEPASTLTLTAGPTGVDGIAPLPWPPWLKRLELAATRPDGRTSTTVVRRRDVRDNQLEVRLGPSQDVPVRARVRHVDGRPAVGALVRLLVRWSVRSPLERHPISGSIRRERSLWLSARVPPSGEIEWVLSIPPETRESLAPFEWSAEYSHRGQPAHAHADVSSPQPGDLHGALEIVLEQADENLRTLGFHAVLSETLGTKDLAGELVFRQRERKLFAVPVRGLDPGLRDPALARVIRFVLPHLDLDSIDWDEAELQLTGPEWLPTTQRVAAGRLRAALENRTTIRLEAPAVGEPIAVRVEEPGGAPASRAWVAVCPMWAVSDGSLRHVSRVQADVRGLAVFRRIVADNAYVVFASTGGCSARRVAVAPGTELHVALEEARRLVFEVRNEDGSVPTDLRARLRTEPARMAPEVSCSVEGGTVTCEPFSQHAYQLRLQAGARKIDLRVAELPPSGVVVLPGKN